ncbi:vesicle coat component [Gnomoniopsis smithogilvyi]|uniref:Protein transport protein sec16 n=1 Tax=Gnomoniopsis smithogilvyi TaxID=1191159 RepID=A0A9W8YQJ1_9PEZI|nr:vesicle coat component [Gnomoniopsis smithogilvyi]
MSGDAPSASWHPAFMPHTDANITPNLETIDQTPPNPSPKIAESEQPVAAAPRELLNTSEGQSSGGDEWFPDYEAGSPWKSPEEGEAQLQEEKIEIEHAEAEPEAAPEAAPDIPQDQESTQLVEQVVHEPEPAPSDEQTEATRAPQQVAPEVELEPTAQTVVSEELVKSDAQQEEKATDEAVETAPATDIVPNQGHVAEEGQVPSGPSHFSKDSFARTVSQEPNLEDDDDETPWSLPRADTDLFKFMPPNTRTNSFPVVPQLDSHQHHGHVRQLSTNQAEDIVNEIEHESENLEFEDGSASHGGNALQQDNFWGDDDAEASFPAQLGGDIQNPDEEASDARFAEGLPLISHDQADGAEDRKEAMAHDPFAEDGSGEGDDFFAQIGGNADSSDQPEFIPGQLDRKSTMQVLGDLNGADNNGAGGKLNSTLEEDEDELLEDSPVPEPAAEPQVEDTTTAVEDTNLKPPEAQGEDLAAKWSQAFAEDEDDDFLLEDHAAEETEEGKTVDPSAFFVDDDEGFLEDTEEQEAPPAAIVQPPSSASNSIPPPTGASNKYLPVAAAQPTGLTRQPSNPYFPTAPPTIPQPQILAPVAPMAPGAASPYAMQSSQPPTSTPYGAPPPRPVVNKGQSFADKSKGGYQSPYDLPMEVVKPRKRASMQQLPRATSSAPPPGPPTVPRSSSTGTPGLQGPPPQGPPQLQSSGSFTSPPSSNHSGQSPSLSKPPQQLNSKTGFFEELPLSSKPRPGSRTSNRSQPSPMQASFNGPPQTTLPSPLSMPTPPQEPSLNGSSATPDIPKLVPPAPKNPYAALPAAAAASAPSVVPPTVSRYSPASSQGPASNGSIPPPSRYSPAPAAQRVASYGPNATTQPAALPHLPRTSSPLAHFEARPVASHSEPPPQLSRGPSSLYEPRLNRMSSLPPTREVEEEDTTAPARAPPPPTSQIPPRTRQNAPPPLDSHNMSPPKRRISYGPVPVGAEATPIPPPRSQTGSPGAMYGLRSPIKASETVGRPSSAHGQAIPTLASALSHPDPAPMTATRPRGFSQKLNLIPPTDGRELDILQRWKGVPLISWGVGGNLVTSFPVDVPRYGMNQVGPMIVRSPGEVKVKTIKDVQPLEDRLANFPGPLKGKSKKKETLAWLTAGIEELEKSLPNPGFQTQLSHEDKRAAERILLWKVLRVMVENDGMLEGNPTVNKAVRDVLSLASTAQDIASPVQADVPSLGGFAGESSTTQMQPDSVDSGTIERLKKSLLAGEREKAVWDAADKRLWGHALLIANTVSPDLYHKVSQEFIKKEVNFPGHNNESLAALYSVLSGNHEESVDELVPVHARAGVQMVGTTTGPASGSGMDGLEKWRETLTLILSNRSTGDAQALNALGNLLSGYGRAEAAHICFLFARSATVFGGLDDPRSQFVLVGADHRTQSQQFFKETEALLLSEVYEYGLSLTGTPSLANGVPHLSVYKLQHAMTLAEHGFRDKALQYCDMILKDMSAQTRRSPYHHVVLESAVEDLRQRILQAPNKEGSNSWISKPSMDKVSSSVWSRFNKFVAGDDADAPGQGSPKFGEESGPFAGLQGGTPTVSRPPSAGGATGMDMFSSPNGYPGAASLAPNTSPVLTRTASRYAPGAAQSPAAASPYEPVSSYTPSGRSSMERTSGEYSRSPYEPRRSSDFATGPAGGYIPAHVAAPAQALPDPALGISNNSPYLPAPQTINTTAAPPNTSHTSGPQTPSTYTPYSQQSPYAPVANNASPYAPGAPVTNDKPAVGDGQSYGYGPTSLNTVPDEPVQADEVAESTGGYEPPSFQPYGYEPPSYQPDAETGASENEDEAKPKKKSFMDDDDDNFPSMSASQTVDKSKSQKDKENEELFRKAAEEDAKRAEEEKAAKAKKGWGFGGWFGGGKKDSLDSASPNKPVRAKLGEKSSFVYDPEQKRWVNKAAGAEAQAPVAATPPPPRAMPRSASAMPPSSGTPPPPAAGGGLAPPPNPRTVSLPAPSSGSPTIPGSATPPMMRSASGTSNGPPSAPPSRPATSMSNASSIDDLLGAAAPRKGGARGKKKGGGRYVDVMAK